MKSVSLGKYSLLSLLAIIAVLFLAIIGALALLDTFIFGRKAIAVSAHVMPGTSSAELAQSRADVVRLQKENLQLKNQQQGFIGSGGFMEWPKPDPGKSYYFLVLASVRGTAIIPEELNSSYHLVYDLEQKKYVAIHNFGAAIGGRDFVYEVRGEPSGVISFSPHLHEAADALMKKFGVVPGSTR